MPNGQPLIPDLSVLSAYGIHECGAMQRLMAATGLSHKQAYAHLSKRRFGRWIDYGTCLENGWLTPAGIAELERLKVATPFPSI